MKKFIFSIFLFFSLLEFISGQINSLGLPFIRNYLSKEYNAHPMNWCIAQDQRGVLYFGSNNNGILEYDGSNWIQYPLPNGLIARSIAVDKTGTIYIGADGGEFGMLQPDKKGNLKYVSLSKYTDVPTSNVWKTYATDHGIYFCTTLKLFKYNPPNPIEIIPLETNGFWSFCVNDKIYIGNDKKGLTSLDENDKQYVVEGGDFFAGKSIFMVQPYKRNKIIVGTGNDGLFTFDSQTEKFVPASPEKEFGFALYNGCYLNNQNYALATLDQGVLLVNDNGISKQFTNKLGIQTATITDIYNNPNPNFTGTIWITSDNGISKIEQNSPIRFLDSEFGLSGQTNCIIRFNNTLYVGTVIGLFYLEYNKGMSPVFKRISGIDETLSFLIYKTPGGEEKLLAGSSKGLIEVANKRVNIIDSKWINVFCLLQPKSNPSLIIAGTDDGEKTIKYANGQWINENRKRYIYAQVSSLAEDSKGNIWACSNKDTIVSFDNALLNPKRHKIDSVLLDLRIQNIDNNIILATSKGIYKYNESTDKFSPFDMFGKNFANKKAGVLRISKGVNDKYWLNLYDNTGDNKRIVTVTKYGTDVFKVDSVSFKRFPKISIWGIYNEPSGITWLGTSEGLYSYDNNFVKNYRIKFNALIRNVTIGEDSVLFYGTYFKRKNPINGTFSFDSLMISVKQPEELKPVLAYKHNNLTFNFSAPFFEDEASIRYSRFLEGNDEGWSKWKSETKAIFTNLQEGKYTFHVKAKNVFGIESNIASYEFTIKPPWYRTIWAYISYVIILISLIWGIVAIATYRMKQLNIAYGRYLPGSFLKLLDKARVIDLKLGDIAEKEVTIMFSDIRSYTNLSESMKPHDNFRFLVSYLGKIGDMLHQNTGFPVQYYGDGIMAMFHGDTDYAVQAAIDMHHKVLEYSEERKAKGRRELRIGVGLHTGKIVMGIRGDARRWEGGIVGDSVNLAARMEGLTKMYGAWTMMTDDTFSKLKNPKKFNVRFLGKVKVKGKDIPVGIYELIDGIEPIVFNLKMKTKTHFDAALEYFFEKDFEKSKDLFTSVAEENPEDIAALHYIETIKHILVDGIPNDWDGVEKLDKK